jgi:alanine racemase
MAVVKANGYGHGDVAVARAAVEAGASWLGVALVEEGIRLVEAGVEAPILVLTEFPPGAEADALAAGLTPSAYTEGGLAALSRAAARLGRRVGVHVKLDTGMHRVGLPAHAAVEFCSAARGYGLEVEGVWTHFAKSEVPSDPFTELQLHRFQEALGELESQGIRPRYRHAANSGAALAFPRANLDMVRVGIAMYGLSPGPDVAGLRELRPAMTWTSAVAMVKRVPAGERISYGLHYEVRRESNIATVPVGYADGYSRLLSGRADVLIRGRRYPVAGSVTMDQIMVDCRDDPVDPGDEVILLGRQGEDEITADDIADWMGTVNYEVVCGVSPRVPREYTDRREGP